MEKGEYCGNWGEVVGGGVFLHTRCNGNVDGYLSEPLFVVKINTRQVLSRFAEKSHI